MRFFTPFVKFLLFLILWCSFTVLVAARINYVVSPDPTDSLQFLFWFIVVNIILGMLFSSKFFNDIMK